MSCGVRSGVRSDLRQGRLVGNASSSGSKVIASFVRGAAPILSIEFARRTIPADVRPTFQEMEATCKRKAGDAAGAPAPDAGAAPPVEKSA